MRILFLSVLTAPLEIFVDTVDRGDLSNQRDAILVCGFLFFSRSERIVLFS
jgi:hypothetical protein